MSKAEKAARAWVTRECEYLKGKKYTYESTILNPKDAYLAGYKQAIDDASDAVDEWEEGSDDYTAGLLSSKISKLKDDEV